LPTSCKIEGCDSKIEARGWCSKHYQRWRRHGDPLYTEFCVDELTVKEILSNCTAMTNGCLEWNRGRVTGGYGTFIFEGKIHASHRAVLELSLNRSLAPKMLACHKCDNPPCCNPDHLFEGSSQKNIDDMFSKGCNKALFGESHGNSKLNEASVLEIKMLLQSGESCASIARRHNVNPRTILDIKHGLTWKHTNFGGFK